MNSTIATSAYSEAVHQALAPLAHGGEIRAHLGVEGEHLVEVRIGAAGRAEARHRGLEQPRDPGKVEAPVEEARHRDVVGRDQRGRRPRAEPARLPRDSERREARLVRRAEVEARGGDEVGRGGR